MSVMSPLMRGLSQKMEWAAKRQKVLSDNIAHADTPHFRPKDLEAFDLKKTLRGRMGGVSQTHKKHIVISSGSDKSVYQSKLRPIKDQIDVGNGVILEEEMLKVSETQSSHSKMLKIYQRQYGMLKTAIGRNGGGQ